MPYSRKNRAKLKIWTENAFCGILAAAFFISGCNLLFQEL